MKSIKVSDFDKYENILILKGNEVRETYPHNEVLEAPKGYEFTGKFEKPVKEGFYLAAPHGDYAAVNVVHSIETGNRLILKKVKRKVYIFIETGEYRKPCCGDWIKLNGNFIECKNNENYSYQIYKLEIKEE